MTTLLVIAVVVGMSLLIPLCVWGATGSFRHALHAWRQWGLIVGGAFLAIGALAVVFSMTELL